MRIGHGYDVHKLVEGRKLILAGVEIPNQTGLLGHSDADVVTHSIMDALLGAACLGDIGLHFPDNNEKFKNISSLKLLEEVMMLLADFKVNNIDCTIVAQQPKLRPYIDLMQENIKKICKTPYVNIKATTEEGLGFTGSKQGISCYCVCTIE
ncbi:MAG: 2-C-methyl-D-erythritol 2,4-cyclodiphosphate synthase [Oscillospiraceae bacterium]